MHCSGFRVRSPSDKIDFVNFAQSSRPGMTVCVGPIVLAGFYRSVSAFPPVAEPRLERGDSG
jgi:hypothetical protein